VKAKAEAGNAEAQFELGSYYLDQGTSESYSNGVTWFHKAAEQNYPKAQSALGVCYLRGQGVAPDISEAAEWLTKAEGQGDPDARAVVLSIGLLGFPIGDKKTEHPIEDLRLLAGQGNANAEIGLGIAYSQGKGVGQDPKRAAEWFQKAARQKDIFAEAYLANAYYLGRGVLTNYSRALRWARAAAEKGDASGQEVLGLCYKNGKGVAKDNVVAFQWFQKAANQGGGRAEFSLGYAYQHGEGVAKDLVKAYEWFDRSAVNGNPKSIAARDELGRVMTPSELLQAGVVPRKHLTKFDRSIIDAHEQRYGMSCIPSAVEMTLKLMGRVGTNYYEQQDWWKEKADGSFHNFDGKIVAGTTYHQRFTQGHGKDFPLAQLFEAIDRELSAGRYVIIGLPAEGGTHDWVIYDETTDGEFLAVSKSGPRTLENNHVRKTITDMKGTDIGTYDGP